HCHPAPLHQRPAGVLADAVMVAGNDRHPALSEEGSERLLEGRHLLVATLVGDVAGHHHVIHPGFHQHLAQGPGHGLPRRSLTEVKVREVGERPQDHAPRSDSSSGAVPWSEGKLEAKPGDTVGVFATSGTSRLPERTRSRLPRHTTVRAKSPCTQVRKRSRSFTQTTPKACQLNISRRSRLNATASSVGLRTAQATRVTAAPELGRSAKPITARGMGLSSDSAR